MHGTILPKDKLIMTRHVGSGGTEGGPQYTMSMSMNGSPIIQSETTGKRWSINWNALIKLAIAEGVDDE